MQAQPSSVQLQERLDLMTMIAEDRKLLAEAQMVIVDLLTKQNERQIVDLAEFTL